MLSDGFDEDDTRVLLEIEAVIKGSKNLESRSMSPYGPKPNNPERYPLAPSLKQGGGMSSVSS